MFPDFDGVDTDYGGCHDSTDPESPTGYVEIISLMGNSFEPGEIFIISVKVINFSEGALQSVVLGFANENPGRSDNKEFSFNVSYIDLDLDGVGNSSIFYFELVGPDSAGNFTLIADVLWKNGDNVIQFASGELKLDFSYDYPPGTPIIENYFISEEITEVGTPFFIQVDAYDLETIVTQVLIEFDGVNHSMINIINNTYQYDRWNPISEGVKNFKISAIDTSNLVNVISKSLIVQDTVKPTINHINHSSSIKLGNDFIVGVHVTDHSGIENVLIKLDGVNHSLTEMDDNIWQFILTPTIANVYVHTVYVIDNNNNVETREINYNVVELLRFFGWIELSVDQVLIFGYLIISILIYTFGIVLFIAKNSGKKNQLINKKDLQKRKYE